MQAAQSGQSEHKQALAQLLSDYWYPLYAYLRRSGKLHEEAEDLIQEFFAHLIEKEVLSDISSGGRGRFRNFLLVCLKNFVINHWQKQSALKRGGNKKHLSLDFDQKTEYYSFHPSDDLTPERAFDRAWAIEIINHSLQKVAQSWHDSGKGEQFRCLRVFLLPEDQTPPYRETAEQLGVSVSALKVTIHRLKAEFRKALCAEVSDTLLRGDLLEDELNRLFSALSA